MCGYCLDVSVYRKKPLFPDTLTDLHRFRKTIHGHDGSSRIVMVRKTDQRTFASIKNGEEPKLETITRETIETFRGQRSECKVTTEKKNSIDKCPPSLIGSIERKKSPRKITPSKTRRNPIMEFQNEFLKAHNEYRRRHDVMPLKLNKKICEMSQKWADVLVKRSRLEHSSNTDYGENIYCLTSTDVNLKIPGNVPVENWYSEIDNHTFYENPSDLKTGHFTQVVWKDTQEVGVGYAKLKGKIVVVANYYPPGNIIGQFATNVPTLNGFKKENNNDILVCSSKSLERAKSPNTTKNLLNGTEGNFEEDFLNAHNEYRRRHGVEPLELDKKLCKYSTEYAKILASKNILEHRKNCPYGENIYSVTSSDPNFTISGHTPVDDWYQEMNNHPFGREPSTLNTGHFTQMVWKSSKVLGVGVAKSNTGRIYVVANYSPPGNFVQCYTENVLPLVKDTSNVERVTSECTNLSIDDYDRFQLDALKVHNEYRKKHGSPPLKLNKELCDIATDWAQQCAKSKSLGHRPNNQYGENIFCMYSSDYNAVPSARDAIKEWYDEEKEHNYDSEYNMRSLHFTQVVWKDCKELGIGIAKNDNGSTYVIANYNPRGNVRGYFMENVQRPRS